MTKIVYLGLGSNMGDRAQFLQQAAQWLQLKVGLVTKLSRVYEAEAWGFTNQPPFYNQVLELITSLSPSKLLEACFEIEQMLGRVRGALWGQRTLDIDILWYDGRAVQLPNLIIPHPYLHLRRFVLVPFCEIAPYVIHPTMGMNMQQLLDNCPDTLDIKPVSI